MFRGRKQAEKASLQSPSDICIPDDRCDLQEQEGVDVLEALESTASQQLDTLATLAQNWEVTSQNVSVYIGDQRKRIVMGDLAVSSSRDQRRNLAKRQESTLAANIANAHNRAAHDLEASIPSPLWRSNLPLESAPPALLLKGLSAKLTLDNNKKMQERGSATFLYEGLLATFQNAYIARAFMQVINERDPEALQMAFDPASLKELAPSLQRLALIDLAHGNGSVLLNNARKVTETDQTQAERLKAYINGNHLPEGVRKTLLSINMGMQVMGAPKCPFNDLGICIHQLARIPDAQLPEELRKDMAAREGSIAQRRVSGLLAFAQSSSVSRIFDDTIVFNETDGQKAAQRKRSAPAVTIERRDMTMAETVESAPSFSRVVVRTINGSDTYTLEDINDAEHLQEVIAQLIDEKPVKKYMETYRTDKLDDVFGAAFTAIMTLPHYRNTDNTISQWANRKQKPYINTEGVPETYRRYSASRASGTSGGQVGRRTRVLFSEGIKNGTRYVTIHRIMRRDDRVTNLKLR